VPTDGIYIISASATIRIISASTTISSEFGIYVNDTLSCQTQRTEEYLSSSGGFIQFVSRITQSLALKNGDKVDIRYASDQSGQYIREGIFFITRVGMR
jgi:hypothetical protein